MPLPRFTSGSVGKLTFKDLNEAFDLIEGAPKGDKPSTSNDPQVGIDFQRHILTVRLVSQFSGTPLWEFKEVVHDSSSASMNLWVDLDGGRTSSDGRTPPNLYAYPVFAPSAAVGDVLFVHATNDSAGRLRYLPISPSTTTNVIFGRITGNTVITANTKWTYNLTRVERSGGGWSQISPAFNFTAINGCENAVDGTPANTYGVGFEPPTPTPTLTRRPIKTGTVVECRLTVLPGSSATEYAFSIPNGYKVVCP